VLRLVRQASGSLPEHRTSADFRCSWRQPAPETDLQVTGKHIPSARGALRRGRLVLIMAPSNLNRFEYFFTDLTRYSGQDITVTPRGDTI